MQGSKSGKLAKGVALGLMGALMLSACSRGPAANAMGANGLAARGVGPMLAAPLAIPGNRVKLLTDAPQIFPAMEAAIREAKTTVQLEIFMLGGEVGMGLVKAMLEAKARGVHLQVVVDPKRGGGGETAAQVARCLKALTEAGVEVRDYPVRIMPKGPTWLSGLGVLDHVKSLVIDGKVAFAGGMNFYDLGAHNHDYMVRVDGPAAFRMGAMVDEDWRRSGPEAPALPALQAPAAMGSDEVALALTSPTERNIRTQMVERFDQAKGRIWVEVLFLDDDAVIDAMVRAKARGVDVQVLLDPIDWGKHVPELDFMPFKGIPNWAGVMRLMQAGATVAWFQSPDPHANLHAKTAIVDDHTLLIGSANFTYRSMDRSRELQLAVRSPEAVAAYARQFQIDMAAGKRAVGLTRFQRILAGLFDKVKRGIYNESRDLPPVPNGPEPIEPVAGAPLPGAPALGAGLLPGFAP